MAHEEFKSDVQPEEKPAEEKQEEKADAPSTCPDFPEAEIKDLVAFLRGQCPDPAKLAKDCCRVLGWALGCWCCQDGRPKLKHRAAMLGAGASDEQQAQSLELVLQTHAPKEGKQAEAVPLWLIPLVLEVITRLIGL